MMSYCAIGALQKDSETCVVSIDIAFLPFFFLRLFVFLFSNLIFIFKSLHLQNQIPLLP